MLEFYEYNESVPSVSLRIPKHFHNSEKFKPWVENCLRVKGGQAPYGLNKKVTSSLIYYLKLSIVLPPRLHFGLIWLFSNIDLA